MKKGIFIAFEGLDGSGKTSRIKSLYDELQKNNIECLIEREPSDSSAGVLARQAIEKQITLSQEALALIFAADRYEHVTNRLLPCLEKGVHVLCDRYVFSNLAYQGLQLGYEDILAYNRLSMELLMPDLTIFIDVEPSVSLQRIDASRANKELFDEKGFALRRSFFKTFELLDFKSRVAVIDGNRPEAEVALDVFGAVKPLLFGE